MRKRLLMMSRIGSRYFQIRRKQKHYTHCDSRSGTRLTGSPPVCRESTNLLLLEALPPHPPAGNGRRAVEQGLRWFRETCRVRSESKSLITLQIKSEPN